jgi:chemotaxis family two-component system response regulator Rcp1
VTQKDERQVLAEIKEDENLKRIPVVVFTASKAEKDVLRTYDLRANCYITKPTDIEKLFKIVRSIEDFWLTVVRLPPDGERG